MRWRKSEARAMCVSRLVPAWPVYRNLYSTGLSGQGIMPH